MFDRNLVRSRRESRRGGETRRRDVHSGYRQGVDTCPVRKNLESQDVIVKLLRFNNYPCPRVLSRIGWVRHKVKKTFGELNPYFRGPRGTRPDRSFVESDSNGSTQRFKLTVKGVVHYHTLSGRVGHSIGSPKFIYERLPFLLFPRIISGHSDL